MTTPRAAIVAFLSALAMLVALIGCRVGPSPTPAPSTNPQLLRAHSHNDYNQPNPLNTALALGFGSIEADVFLVDGQLLVAHDREDCDPSRTLDGMYLTPLLRRVQEHGAVYPGLEPGRFVLMIDIKADAENAYHALHQRLERDAAAFTRVENGTLTPGPITVIISGARPRQTMLAQPRRLAMYDGRLPDLQDPALKPDPTTFMPLVSDAWTSQFRWIGLGEMPPQERARLREIIALAHARGHRLRFWGAGNLPAMYRLLRDEGVDLIGADNLPLLTQVLTEDRDATPKP